MKCLNGITIVLIAIFMAARISLSFGETSSGEIDVSHRMKINILSANQTQNDAAIDASDEMPPLHRLPPPIAAASIAADPVHHSSARNIDQHQVIVSKDNGRNFTNLVRIADILDVFDLERVGDSWSMLSGQISGNCSIDMMDYLQGLQSGRLWAIKSK